VEHRLADRLDHPAHLPLGVVARLVGLWVSSHDRHLWLNRRWRLTTAVGSAARHPLLGDLAMFDAHPRGGDPVVGTPPPHDDLVAGAGRLHRLDMSQQAAGGQPAVQPPAAQVTVAGVDDGVGRVEQRRALDVAGRDERGPLFGDGARPRRKPVSHLRVGPGEGCGPSGVSASGAGHVTETPLAP